MSYLTRTSEPEGLALESKSEADWPPPYTITRHARSRNLRMSLCVEQGLKISAPLNVSDARIRAFIEDKRAWLSQHQAVLEGHQARLSRRATRPHVLWLEAARVMIYLDYQDSLRSRVRQISANHWSISLKAQQSFAEGLQKVVALIAQKFLALELESLGKRQTREIKGLKIRSQSSVWGSCSPTGNLSLNSKLIFLPRALCQHVILHELAHLVHMNHSPKFWAYLARLDPKLSLHKQQLKHAQRYIPAWWPK